MKQFLVLGTRLLNQNLENNTKYKLGSSKQKQLKKKGLINKRTWNKIKILKLRKIKQRLFNLNKIKQNNLNKQNKIQLKTSNKK